MIATTFKGESVYLLHDRPNLQTNPTWELSFLSDVLRSKDGTEARPLMADDVHSLFTFHLDLVGDDSAQFRVALQRLGPQRILCPFWPSLRFASDPVAPIQTGIWLTFEQDFSHWEIHETAAATTFAPSATAWKVPLMLGLFDKEPVPKSPQPDILSSDIAFLDTGPAANQVAAIVSDGPAGPTLANGRTPKIFSISPDWSKDTEAGQAHFEISRQNYGYSRMPAIAFYPHSAARVLTLGFTKANYDQIVDLVSFFILRRGLSDSFWIPGVLQECRLVASTSSTVIQVNDASKLGDNRWIALYGPAGVAGFHVLAVDLAANTLTLDRAPGSYDPATTLLASLILGRFNGPKLKLTFADMGIAQADIGFIETPNEYADPAGEVYGETHGAVPNRAWLFRFHVDLPGGSPFARVTSYGRNVNVAGEIFISDNLEHTDIPDNLELDTAQIEMKGRIGPNNPLRQFSPNTLEGELYCDVLKCEPDASGNAGTAEPVFLGVVVEPSFKGPNFEAKINHLLAAIGGDVPTMLKQPTCNTCAFTEVCALVKADWTLTANVLAIAGNVLSVGGLVATGGKRIPTAIEQAADAYALGSVWFGSGATYQERFIFSSAFPGVGDRQDLTLEMPFTTAPTGPVSLVPGCDQQDTTCDAKFNHHAFFMGHKYVPNGNPSVVKVVSNQSTGKK